MPLVARCRRRGLVYHGCIAVPSVVEGRVRVWASTAILCLVVSHGVATDARAQQDPDRQAWVQVLAQGQLGDAWRTHLEVQPRFMNDASELGLTIVRGAIGRRVLPRATLFLGYGWVPRTLGSGVRDERRVWQQLSVTGPAVGGWAASARIRLEQRTLDPWTDVSHRLRMLARLQRGASAPGRWGAYGYNELMLTLDDTTRGPASGFDRNRFSAGLSRRFTASVAVDAGYLWEHAVFGAGRRDDHTAIGVLNLTWPRR
jgi:Protein of unknown function (DUF2490)